MDTRKPPLELSREYGPFGGTNDVAGVTFDGTDVWYADGESLRSFDPGTGEAKRTLPVRGDAGTAFDGTHFFQIAKGEILKIDPTSGDVLSRFPAPSEQASGLTWAEGSLWVGVYRDRKIHRVDPSTGRIQHTIDSARFVTGVTFVEGDLWYGTWEGDDADVRHADKETGAVLEALPLPKGMGVSGLEFDGKETFYAGGGKVGKVRAFRRPR
jgi:glutamine cyclotransferase